jgi:hypothetical protein
MFLGVFECFKSVDEVLPDLVSLLWAQVVISKIELDA